MYLMPKADSEDIQKFESPSLFQHDASLKCLPCRALKSFVFIYSSLDNSLANCSLSLYAGYLLKFLAIKEYA